MTKPSPLNECAQKYIYATAFLFSLLRLHQGWCPQCIWLLSSKAACVFSAGLVKIWTLIWKPCRLKRRKLILYIVLWGHAYINWWPLGQSTCMACFLRLVNYLAQILNITYMTFTQSSDPVLWYLGDVGSRNKQRLESQTQCSGYSIPPQSIPQCGRSHSQPLEFLPHCTDKLGKWYHSSSFVAMAWDTQQQG